MFAKKLLCVVASLFVGIQLVNAETITPCGSGSYTSPADCTTGVIDNYCTKGEYIFGVVSGETSCVDVIKNEVAVFEGNSKLDLSTGEIANVSDVKVFDCDKAGKCTETFGYIKVDTDYYEVPNGGSVAKLESSDMTTKSSGKLYTGGLLYVDEVDVHAIDINTGDGNYYVLKNSDSVFSGSVGDVVVKSGTNALTFVSLTSTSSYLVKDNAGEIASTAGDTIVIKGSDYSIDTSINGNDYCVDDKMQVWERKDGLCKSYIVDSEDCSFYYGCGSGENCVKSDNNMDPRAQQQVDCIPNAENSNDCNGYYLTNSENNALIKSTGDGTYNLWNCSTGRCDDETNSHPIGYLKNAGTPSDYPYIECNLEKCIIATIAESNTGCVDSGPTTGQVTYGGLYKSNSNYKLCKVYQTATPSNNEIITSEDGVGKYFIDIGTKSILGLPVKNDHFIAIDIDGENGNIKIVNDNVRYRYTLNGEYLIHERSTAKGETSGGQICESGVTPFEYILNQWDTIEAGGNEVNANYYIQE
ncbi:hypothetical protein BCR36DRAFT_586401 [Piromyces finnis]|uniref:Uncharacterized protein n=1 Tax=Piromyces finnis TaxID=1754191 RepID=A0A1Y1UZI9_9FUNG|nr:hypothetical protein BCR36DRAFT_586401 [Piromyces finnis]|eukprot:ORX43941.1 hypothetical protein BCR36DRAFT_586401 [Piromyces finnis]